MGLASSNFGISVSLNSNGTIVAVGASHASSNDVPNHGAIQVYLWDPERETWKQLGNSIQGSQPNQMTGNAVCISDAGEVLAGASYGYDTIINGHLASDSGKVNVYYMVQK
jgi:6-phosphogluconolactonase (cycloisomerase 2 family)